MWHARRLLALLPALLLALGGCDRAHPPATRITLVAHNTLGFDIFVPDEVGQGGLTVGHAHGSDFTPINEAPVCACQTCAQACVFQVCNCGPQLSAHRIRAGESFMRVFDGNDHPATRASCGAGDLGPVCLQEGEPLASGRYDLQLCFATGLSGASAAADDFEATFDASALTCVTQSFSYPDQTQWEISPAPPTPCGPGQACPDGQLCQQGICSATCLANGIPALGASWDVAVSRTDDEAFFTRIDGDPVRYTGAGQVGTALYSQGVLDLRLSRAEGVGHAVGEVNVQLPSTVQAVPFVTGETVMLTVVPLSDEGDGPSAITVRDGSGNLILAAEKSYGTRVLTGDDLSPLTVSATGNTVACDEHGPCGRTLHASLEFEADGASAEVVPGQTGTLTADGLTWNLHALANDLGDGTSPPQACTSPVAFGYAVVQDRSL